MKIVKTQQEFKPINIVLESQDEVNWVYELFGSVAGVGAVRKFVDSVYYGLEDIANDDEDVKVFKGSVEIALKGETK